LVLDSSVALAWCFVDEHTPAITALLERVAETGASAPLLWPLEVSNGLLMAERRGRLDATRRHQLLDFLRDLPVTIDPETVSSVWSETVGMAERYRLTIYDAAYLELARRRALPLASLDQDLRAAARAVGLALLGR
jgi:predicted nucleic acid-binding protein